ncbi:Thymidine phosphorylase [Candidatus Hepatincolaceae symbiont of Richtersius coronifer]
MLLVKEIIRKKRDKQELSKEEIDFFIEGVTKNVVTNEQISAWAMAIIFNGATIQESTNIALAMRDSGEKIVFDKLKDKPIVDKHSTGGVGDLISMILAPMVAACGAYVPMITGKGLGHTGGTSDKMDSIPGYNTYPRVEKFQEVTGEVGCCIIGQTSRLAPADRRIYAIRDTTATVESPILIATSILSKKLAAGINYLSMDLKVGNGAFMKNLEEAENLAKIIIQIAKFAGVKASALLTDMNESLGDNIGNTLEIKESVEYLLGKSKNQKLHEINLSLGAEMLLLTSLAVDEEDARKKLNTALTSGKAAQIFDKMVQIMGGPRNFIDSYETILTKAKIVKPIYAKKSGYVTFIDNRELGLCLVHLGGGRKTITDKLDYSVGLEKVVKVGDKIEKNQPLAILHCNDEAHEPLITEILNKIIVISEYKDGIQIIKPIYKKIV